MKQIESIQWEVSRYWRLWFGIRFERWLYGLLQLYFVRVRHPVALKVKWSVRQLTILLPL